MAQTVTLSVPASGRKITVHTGLFINNEFVPSVDSKETIEYVYVHIRRVFPLPPGTRGRGNCRPVRFEY